MIIQTISYCRTVQVKQYEPVKIEVAGVPGEGQTAAEAFAELMQFVDGQVAAACAATNGAPVGTSKSTAPPLKNGKGKTAANPTPAATAAEPPFETQERSTTRTSTATKATPTTANGKTGTDGPLPNNAPPLSNGKAKAKASQKELRAAFDKEVSYTCESESLQELATRFVDLTALANPLCFGVVSVGEWADVLDGISDRYKQLDGNGGSDPDASKLIIARGKAERQRIANALKADPNAQLQEASA